MGRRVLHHHDGSGTRAEVDLRGRFRSHPPRPAKTPGGPDVLRFSSPSGGSPAPAGMGEISLASTSTGSPRVLRLIYGVASARPAWRPTAPLAGPGAGVSPQRRWRSWRDKSLAGVAAPLARPKPRAVRTFLLFSSPSGGSPAPAGMGEISLAGTDTGLPRVIRLIYGVASARTPLARPKRRAVPSVSCLGVSARGLALRSPVHLVRGVAVLGVAARGPVGVRSRSGVA
jgi:hypothetical protein